MMMTGTRDRRWIATGAIMAAALVASACEGYLDPEQPSQIAQDAVESPEAANAMRIGALNDLRMITTRAESMWLLGGLLTDEWRVADATEGRIQTDQRVPDDNISQVASAYLALHRMRGRAQDAVAALQTFLPQVPAYTGQMYFAEGFALLTLAENFCNGIPLGRHETGVPVYTDPLPTAEVYAAAIAKFDTALTYATGTDTLSVKVQRAALIGKARALVNLGQDTAAASAVAPVPTSMRWWITTSTALSGDDSQLWSLNVSQRRYSVGDSVEGTQQIFNAIPFARAVDPRVRVTGNPTTCTAAGQGLDGRCRVDQTIWTQDSWAPVVSGVDARLIEAEAELQAEDFDGMTTILNDLRASGQALSSTFTSPVLTPLAVPATEAEATDLLFREWAFWTYGRGQRLPNLRRLVRQYGRAEDTVFPTGTFANGQPYGTSVNFPVPASESANPRFNGCLNPSA